MIYVMSDIHGEYDKFIKMLELINLKPSDTLYILGDFFDRGNKPLDIVDYVRKPENNNIKLILGNHESFYLRTVEKKDREDKELFLSMWFQNGGNSTYKQLKQRGEDYEKELIKYLKSLPLYEIVDNFILVHAGLKLNESMKDLNALEIMESQDSDNLLWGREFIFSDKYIEGYTVVCGHTPTIDRVNLSKSKIRFSKGKIMIDCGAFYNEFNGRLGCLRLDDFEEFYID